MADNIINLAKIDFAGGGSTPVPPEPTPSPDANADVVLRDYDGSLVASYSAEEFAALTELPSPQAHDGLTFQGWNWSLADAKAFCALYGKVDICAIYITDDGCTRIKIVLTEGRLSPYLGLGVNGTLDVDWGDGTTHSSVEGSDLETVVNTRHIYAAPGEYTIVITPAEGATFAFVGTANGTKLLWDMQGANYSSNKTYQNAIRTVLIGRGVDSIGAYAFNSCYSLEVITIPHGITSIGNYALQSCSNLKSITIPATVSTIGDSALYICYAIKSISLPKGTTDIGQRAFYACPGLKRVILPPTVTSFHQGLLGGCSGLVEVIIPEGVTSIGDDALSACYSLTSIRLPLSLASIGSRAFANCVSMAAYVIKATTPPSITSTTFNNIPNDAVIYVPSASVDTYKGATNWLAQAGKIQAIP